MPLPGEVPRLSGIDVWGGSVQLNGSVGGDHITYVDFKQRFDLTPGSSAPAKRTVRRRRQPRALPAQGRHRRHRRLRPSDDRCAAGGDAAPGVSARRDLRARSYGQITRRLFENLNTRFYQSSGTHKFVSMIYGEISEDARFRFLSAGAAVPRGVLERAQPVHGGQRAPERLVPAAGHDAVIRRDRPQRTESLLGFKERYEMNEWC